MGVISLIHFSQREKLLKHVNNPTQKGLTDEQRKNALYVIVDNCDDVFYIYLNIKNNNIEIARFEGHGCAISCASMDAILAFIEGKTTKDVINFINRFINFINGDINEIEDDFMFFKLIQDHKSRKKCALAPISTIRKVIENE